MNPSTAVPGYKAPTYIDVMNEESIYLVGSFSICLQNAYTLYIHEKGIDFRYSPSKFLFKADLNTKKNLFEMVSITARNRINLLPNTEESRQQKIMYDECLINTFRKIQIEGKKALLKLNEEITNITPDKFVPVAKELTEVIANTESCVRSLFVTWQA